MTKKQSSILIVDDHPHMRRLHEITLRRGGYESFYFGQDGEEAVVIASEVHPDLIIIDYAMPKLDGVSALEQLQKDERTEHIPSIMVSGCGEFHASLERLQLRATAILTKPYSPTHLLETADRLLSETNDFLPA
jgi:CheY-like chemotaxis protein